MMRRDTRGARGEGRCSRRISPIAVVLATAVAATPLAAQQMPEELDGWPVIELTRAVAPDSSVWVGTYGHGILVHPAGQGAWRRIQHDTSASSLSWDFVHAIAFGPRGEIWYGTIGNGWGLSTDNGRTWKNWTYDQLGPEWQYVAPGGILTLGDTTVIATADGLQVTTDDGRHWLAVVDTTGPPAKGPADTAVVALANEYITCLGENDIAVTIREAGRPVPEWLAGRIVVCRPPFI